jgi:hypothetical protein
MSTAIANIYDEQDSEPTSVMTAAQSSKEVAELQSAMILAKRFPRDQRSAMDRILIACQRKGLAEQAVYSYAKGKTDVSGPVSVWLRQSLGNGEISSAASKSWSSETESLRLKHLQSTWKPTIDARKCFRSSINGTRKTVLTI